MFGKMQQGTRHLKGVEFFFENKTHSRRRSEKGKIALIVVTAIAAKKIFATISAKCASAWFCLFHCNWKNVLSVFSKLAYLLSFFTSFQNDFLSKGKS